jgi:hypothetical protein
VATLKQYSDAYFSTLAALAGSESAQAQVCAVRLFFGVIRSEAEERRFASEGQAVFTVPAPDRARCFLVELLLASSWPEHAVDTLKTEFLTVYVDLRHYFIQQLRLVLEQAATLDGRHSKPDTCEGISEAPPEKRSRQGESIFARREISAEEVFTRSWSLLRAFSEPCSNEAQEFESAELWAPTGAPAAFYLREYRKLFQSAWLRLLSLPVPAEKRKPLLQYLPSHVMTHLSEPLLLSDFYIRSFHSGSAEISVLSLSGLFLLLTRYSLGDPDTLSSSSNEYFAQLYSLIKPNIFRLRQRARFQRLAAASLASGLLPAGFAAAFAKRCLRTAVACEDAGVIQWLMAVAYRLIQAHHSQCQLLLHDPSRAGVRLQKDPFDMTAPLSKAADEAIHTSLWEIQLLRRHRLPAIATLAKLFLKPFFKPTAKRLDPDLFLDQSPAVIYRQLLKVSDRQVAKLNARGQAIPLAFEVPEDKLASRIMGWAVALGTEQRKVGAT